MTFPVNKVHGFAGKKPAWLKAHILHANILVLVQHTATYGVKKARLDMVNIFTKNKYNSILGLFPCGFYQFLHLTVVTVLTIMAQQRKITPLVTVNTFSFSSVFVE